MRQKSPKKASADLFNNFIGIFIAIAVITMAGTVMFLFMAEGKTQIAQTQGINLSNVTECIQDLACNSTMQLQSAGQTVPGWVKLAIIVAVAVALISMVMVLKKVRS